MRVGDVVALTSLITNKTIQFNHHTKELDANGGARFFWEVVKSIRNKPDTTVVQLQSLHSRRFIHVAHDFIVETTTVTSVACDLKVHEMPNQCVALEFLSYPGCFLGFKPSGSAKAATEASKIDQYLVTLQKDAIKKEDDASPVVLPGISKEVPTFTPMPMVYDLVMFNEIAENNAKMYNDYYNELSVSSYCDDDTMVHVFIVNYRFGILVEWVFLLLMLVYQFQKKVEESMLYSNLNYRALELEIVI